MGALNIGRVTDVGDPTNWRPASRDGRGILTMRGFLAGATVADRIAKATELGYQTGQLVAVTYSEASEIDGFYIARDFRSDRAVQTRPHSVTGGIPYEVDLEVLGSAQATMALSKLDGLLIANDYGVLEAEAKYTWCPPIGAEAVRDAGNPATGHERVTPDGNIRVYIGVDPDLDPTYSVAPADYYKGGAAIKLGGYTRTGTDAPEDLTSWKITTGVVDLFADGVNDGVINLQHSVDQTPYGFQIKFNSTTAIPAWNYPSIEYNTPEVCVLTLTRDANEADPTDHTHFFEITARRGFPFFYCRFVWTGNAVAWSVDREAVDAAVAVTPNTGATAAMAIEDSADDANGNRWFLASANTTTKDITNGGLDWAATTEFTFLLGMEYNGSTADPSDDTGDVVLQALASLGEFVEFRRR